MKHFNFDGELLRFLRVCCVQNGHFREIFENLKIRLTILTPQERLSFDKCFQGTDNELKQQKLSADVIEAIGGELYKKRQEGDSNLLRETMDNFVELIYQSGYNFMRRKLMSIFAKNRFETSPNLVTPHTFLKTKTNKFDSPQLLIQHSLLTAIGQWKNCDLKSRAEGILMKGKEARVKDTRNIEKKTRNASQMFENEESLRKKVITRKVMASLHRKPLTSTQAVLSVLNSRGGASGKMRSFFSPPPMMRSHQEKSGASPSTYRFGFPPANSGSSFSSIRAISPATRLPSCAVFLRRSLSPSSVDISFSFADKTARNTILGKLSNERHLRTSSGFESRSLSAGRARPLSGSLCSFFPFPVSGEHLRDGMPSGLCEEQAKSSTNSWGRAPIEWNEERRLQSIPSFPAATTPHSHPAQFRLQASMPASSSSSAGWGYHTAHPIGSENRLSNNAWSEKSISSKGRRQAKRSISTLGVRQSAPFSLFDSNRRWEGQRNLSEMHSSSSSSSSDLNSGIADKGSLGAAKKPEPSFSGDASTFFWRVRKESGKEQSDLESDLLGKFGKWREGASLSPSSCTPPGSPSAAQPHTFSAASVLSKEMADDRGEESSRFSGDEFDASAHPTLPRAQAESGSKGDAKRDPREIAAKQTQTMLFAQNSSGVLKDESVTNRQEKGLQEDCTHSPLGSRSGGLWQNGSGMKGNQTSKTSKIHQNEEQRNSFWKSKADSKLVLVDYFHGFQRAKVFLAKTKKQRRKAKDFAKSLRREVP
ncbi:uncharacterized protein MONOS_6768 [Monocercomonoides exilis]|uniref:uncharacterized protein n=1 Tax=Monocercomonoides exilis TaxID=2049356 RepID=UPI003559CC71|nr:hypothetical protein MONOS_6768 [Monocercomonoides exilis]|eukprot:MONOS_6768.1-p1 / transcript=MONOS_6768.1 / gene=MONOS_6768 / organism=Monocercomonoides_exilis_PA203 / gene_product=unspecified product / transcript_product=unspecified product / location=Mono_scaffold00219:53666-56062(+) / protein_length=763 / sequence_SO=supercontig / SO=protein_coding / is_pseudo=false